MTEPAPDTDTSSQTLRESTESNTSASPLTTDGTRDCGSKHQQESNISHRDVLPRSERKESGVASRNVAIAIANYLKEQYFLVGLGLVIAIASQRQVPSTQQAFKETVVTYLCVSLIFLITGCTLPTKVLLENYSHWKVHLYVQIQCFLMTSAVVYGVVSATATNRNFMDPGLLVGMIFSGVVPTTISSNVVLTRQANGNTAMTVVQSTIGNLLAPFITPLLITMYTSTDAWYTDFLPRNGDDYGAVYSRVLKELGLSVFLPLVSQSPKATLNIAHFRNRLSAKCHKMYSRTQPKQL